MQTTAPGQVTMLPPIPRPPHDPTSWLLNGRVGWLPAKLDQIEYLPPTNSLVLALEPGTRRSLAEPSGSFGGLTAPGNVAVALDGSVYLLDADNAQLTRFDRCECRFAKIPCFGGTGDGPRQLSNPHGIGVCAGNLFVCDSGNHRLSVFALRGFVLRGHWQPPAATYHAPNPVLTNIWEPFDVAFDRHRRVYVTDSANGAVHVFNAAGRWQRVFTGLGSVTWIATDCHDNIFVVVTGPPDEVRLLKSDGSTVAVESRPEELASQFPAVQFAVDREGLIHLGALCTQSGEPARNGAAGSIRCPPQQPIEPGVFDLQGHAVNRCSAPNAASYLTSGAYLSSALDSELYRCQWHRVIVRGDIPSGARVTVSTFTAEAVLTDDQVQSLSDDEWETHQTASETTLGEWDCLVRNGGGRFLWLKLQLQGNGKATPRLDSVEIEFPRISLRRYLPAVFGEEPTSADFTDRFLSLFDTTLRSIEEKVDTQARFYDPLSTPAERDPRTGVDFLSWLASWIGVTLDRNWSEAKRRKFLKAAGRLFDLRGTREGLRRELLLLLDIDEAGCCANDRPRDRCVPRPSNCAPEQPWTSTWEGPPLVLEHFKLRRWLFLGAGRIGNQAVLWGERIINRSGLNAGAQVGRSQLRTLEDPLRDPLRYGAYQFTVFVPACYRNSEANRKSLENLLRNSRPAGTVAHVEFVEPRFRIGFQSTIGFDSVIARYPAGVTLDQTSLGAASVLMSPPHKQGGPSLEVGNQSRIGATTRLK
jgi:phage tail-like protein